MVKRENVEASATVQAELKGAQEEMVQTALARLAELPQALHTQMKQVAALMQEEEEAMECNICMESVAYMALISCLHCFCCLPESPAAELQLSHGLFSLAPCSLRHSTCSLHL